jgi:hypothetical protein
MFFSELIFQLSVNSECFSNDRLLTEGIIQNGALGATVIKALSNFAHVMRPADCSISR